MVVATEAAVVGTPVGLVAPADEVAAVATPAVLRTPQVFVRFAHAVAAVDAAVLRAHRGSLTQ